MPRELVSEEQWATLVLRDDIPGWQTRAMLNEWRQFVRFHRLQLHGSASGGDCDALRILSTNTQYFNLRGHGGNIDILDTIITSWDTDLPVPGPRDTADYTTEDDDKDPRSYIRCCGIELKN